MHDAALHFALLLLGRVIIAVLAEIAELPCSLDLPCDVDPSASDEVVVLGLPPTVAMGAGV
jgi:hypothetical protein